jgi:hypothetical protein
MATLHSPENILSRRRNDHVLIEHLNQSDCSIRVTAHRSAADARAGARPLRVGEGNPPVAYRALYDFDTLISAGRRHRPTQILIDPLANGDYPTSEPVANVIGQVPWTPHFANGVAVCHGHRIWIPNRTQLVDYIIHLGRLLNFDEPPPGKGYTGYNGEAIRWWGRELNYQPLDPGLKFPAIEPTEVLAGRPRLSRAGSGPASGGGSRLRRANERSVSSRLRAVR